MAAGDDPGGMQSLLDVMLAEQANQAHSTSCVVYVAASAVASSSNSGPTSGDAATSEAAVGTMHAKLVQRCIASEGEGAVTGLLLTFPTCVVHLLEGRSSVLQRLLADLTKATSAVKEGATGSGSEPSILVRVSVSVMLWGLAMRARVVAFCLLCCSSNTMRTLAPPQPTENSFNHTDHLLCRRAATSVLQQMEQSKRCQRYGKQQQQQQAWERGRKW